MTREDFNEKVMKQFRDYEFIKLEQSPKRIFDDAYSIAKMTSLKDYLTEADINEKLFQYADTVLNDLCEYEFNYDTPQWGDWDTIGCMVNDFIKEMEKNHDA